MLADLHQHILLMSAVSTNQRTGMRSVGCLQLVLLMALTSRAAGLDIPLEAEQPPTIITKSPLTVIALPLDPSVTLKCEAKGNPPPEYRWTKDGEEFIPPNDTTNRTDLTSGTFVLHNEHLVQFQGKYRCYASNKLGTAMTEEIRLIAPANPKFPNERMNPITVDEGDPVILHCNPPEGFAPPKIYWMSLNLTQIKQDERVSMGMDGNLYFSNAMQKDSRKDYCCFASFTEIRTIVQKNAMAVEVISLKPDKEGAHSDTPLAPPQRMPGLLLPSGVQSEKVLMKGQSLDLECLPEGYPTPTVTWIKLGEELPPRVEYKNFKKQLTISAVEDGDAGKYMCSAKNSAGEVVHYFDVMVEEPPKWLTEPPPSQLTVIGADVHIKCSVSGKPPPDITWRKNGEVFSDDSGNRRVLDDTVVIHNATPEDSAVYQCEASNVHGNILANVNIMIMNLAPQILTRDNQEYAVVVGGDIIMNCSVFGSPSPSVSWTKDGTQETLLGERFTEQQDGSLKISNVQKDDSGNYVCVAVNTQGKSAVIAVLDVKDHTRIINPPQDVEIISGTTAQLICQAEYDKSLQGTFEIVWKKNGTEIPLFYNGNSSFRRSVDDDMLQIMNVNLSDQGTYTCIARTSLDEVNATAFLTVLDVPDAPRNVKISEFGNLRNVTLSWVPGNDHNSSVAEFIVEYEESQWEPGRWKELQKVPGNQATAELALHGNVNYQFRVYAVNAVGPGPPSEPTERHKTPFAAPDRNPENIKIDGHSPHQMVISWQPLSLIEQNGPGLVYKVSYRRLNVDEEWTSHLVRRPHFSVTNTSTYVPYEIKVQSKNGDGWGPEPKIITGYSGEDVPTAAPRDVGVMVINTTVLRVNWTPVAQATVRGHLGGYNVHWLRKRSLMNPSKTLNERHSLAFPGKRKHAIVPQLEPFSEYSLTVNVYNRKGNGPNSDPVIFSTPEGVPQQVPILTASNAQADSIRLVWGPPLEANGILTGYLLQYYRINETTLEVVDSQEINITEADTSQWQLQGLEDGSLYRFHLSACTRAGCGPPVAQESSTIKQALPALLNISSYVSDTFAKISWTATEEQQDSQLYVAYMNNRDGSWRISEAVNTSQSFHVIDGLKPGTLYTVRLVANGLLDNSSIFEEVIQTRVKGVGGQQSEFSTQGWFIGTMCAVALLTLIALMACFLRRNKGGKYAVKAKEDLHPDVESQDMNDDTFCEYRKPCVHEHFQDQPSSQCTHHLMG